MTDTRRRDGYGLTPRQRELLVYLRERALCPTFDEMSAAMSLRRSGVHRLIVALEERDYIRRLKRRARAIEVLDRPLPEASPPNDVIDLPLYGRNRINWLRDISNDEGRS